MNFKDLVLKVNEHNSIFGKFYTIKDQFGNEYFFNFDDMFQAEDHLKRLQRFIENWSPKDKKPTKAFIRNIDEFTDLALDGDEDAEKYCKRAFRGCNEKCTNFFDMEDICRLIVPDEVNSDIHYELLLKIRDTFAKHGISIYYHLYNGSLKNKS